MLLDEYFYIFILLQSCFGEYTSECLHLMSKALVALWCAWFSSIGKCFKQENYFSDEVMFIRHKRFSECPRTYAKVVLSVFSFVKKLIGCCWSF